MSSIAKAIAVYRKRGPSGLAMAARRKLFPIDPVAHAYQVQVAPSSNERWEIIDRAIPDGSQTALDIGCNLGDMTAECAKRGLLTIGVDSSPKLVAGAVSRHRGVMGCGFMTMDIRPDNIDELPRFDVILLLSVHHHWLMAHGPETAGAMLRALADKTGRVLIFEGASRRIRYGDYPPDFVDNDEVTVTAYLGSYLNTHVGDIFRSINLLGKAGCVGDREPYRWSYALFR